MDPSTQDDLRPPDLDRGAPLPPRVVRLAILETYGVIWSRETFARDLLQNFFDAAPDFRDVVLDVRKEEGVVEIRGPATFDVDLLAYIGATTKTTGRTAGGFGEGFKICALVGVRDFGLAMSAGSGADEITVFLDPVPLGRELCYRARTREGNGRAGSWVRLEGCDPATIAAFEAAPSMFRHPDNPKLATVLIDDPAQGIALYASPDPRSGEIYYRRQLRGRTSFHATGGGRPITLAHDGVIDSLEGDRDRRDLPALPVAFAIGHKLAPELLHRAILYLMPYWKYGNDVVSALVAAAAARSLKFSWPPRWLARSLKAGGLNEFAERQGFDLALYAFAQIGMPTPDQHYTNLETRPADPLERARIQVLVDLYTELHGEPARTTEFEVFSLGGSAVRGQHLGSKVIVAADLIAEGFDAVGGTILHELSHEAGGEEDMSFLRRLTRILGAALREPEKIRGARRRYATVEPLPPRPASEAAPVPGLHGGYTPEFGFGTSTADGVVCTVVVPPAFPPTEAIFEALRVAAAEAGAGLWIIPVPVSGPQGAVHWRAPGVPTIWIGDADAEPPAAGDAATLGYRLRTYGPDARLRPSHEALVRALTAARDAGLCGQKGHAAHSAIGEGARERLRDLLGVVEPEPKQTKAPRNAKRDDYLRAYLRHLTGHAGFDLEGRFAIGLHTAGLKLIEERRRDRRAADEIWPEINAVLQRAIALGKALRAADPRFDDADEMERHMMHAAEGAAVLAYVQEADEERAAALAEAHFHAVREASVELLDLDVIVDFKPAVLRHALVHAGLDDFQPRLGGLDLAVFAAAFARTRDQATAMQRRADEDGQLIMGHMLDSKLAEDRPKTRQQRVWARKNALRAKQSWKVRAAHEAALAETGSAVAAAERCLAAAASLLPEDGR